MPLVTAIFDSFKDRKSTRRNRIAYCKFDYILHKYFRFSKDAVIYRIHDLLLDFDFGVFFQCFKTLHYQIVIYIKSG